jgi:hypothetical protein|tara:strand:+ start:148 stop:555 length:408 start_codon:yes stop_codon:yes gene_type:complete
MDNIATIKLVSGEELIAQVEPGTNPLHLKLINPVLVHKQNTAFGPMLSVSHWLMFTKDNEIDIERKNIVALKYGLEDNTIQHYKNFSGKRGPIISLQEQEKLEEILKRTEERMLAEREELFEDDSITEEANTTIH